jgi:hypothetical protein
LITFRLFFLISSFFYFVFFFVPHLSYNLYTLPPRFSDEQNILIYNFFILFFFMYYTSHLILLKYINLFSLLQFKCSWHYTILRYVYSIYFSHA